MVLFEKPDDSAAALEWMTERAEILLQRLGLAYRVLLMSTREMGFTQARKYDLEVWSPGVERWLEVSAPARTSGTSRRGGWRSGIGRARAPSRSSSTRSTGPGLALARVVAALLETYQRPDGNVTVPEVLRPYLGREVIAVRAAMSEPPGPLYPLGGAAPAARSGSRRRVRAARAAARRVPASTAS